MAVIGVQRAGGKNMLAFLDLLAWSEGTATSTLTHDAGYDVIVTGVTGPEVFTDFADHPFAHRPAKIVRTGPPQLVSTASGRYQLLYRYWPGYRAKLGLHDFSPVSQDLVAIQQIRERRAWDAVVTGDVAVAIALCSPTWTSLPGNTYGQGGHTLATLQAQWKTFPTEELA